MTTPTNDSMSVTEKRKIEKKRIADLLQSKKDALRTSLEKSVDSGDVAATAMGQKFITPEMILTVAKAITEKVSFGPSLKGFTSTEVKEALTWLKVPDDSKADSFPVANRVAELTLQCILDHVFTFEGKAREVEGSEFEVFDNQTVQYLFNRIGPAVALELSLYQMWKKEEKTQEEFELFYSTMGILTSPCFTEEAKTIAKRAAVQGHLPFPIVQTWMDLDAAGKQNFAIAPSDKGNTLIELDNQTIAQLGGLLFGCADASELPAKFWCIEEVGKGEEARKYVLLDAFKFEGFIDEIVDNVRVKPPATVLNSWNEYKFGGYITNADEKLDALVRGHNPETTLGPDAVDCLDNLQSVKFIVNKFTTEVANSIVAKQKSGDLPKPFVVGKFVAPKGVHFTKSLTSSTVLAAANEWIESSFMIPWNADYRGRMYPIATVLTMQSTDFEKSLLKFAVAQPLNASTKKWMSVHLANTFGEDKITLDARIAWVEANQELIISVARDAVAVVKSWVENPHTMPSEPWQFIAACEEYVALYVDKSRTTTNLPVATDCSCSGIQILSGLTRDKNAAELVNVLPGNAPQDAYGVVASGVKTLLSGPYRMNVTDKTGTQEKVFDFSPYVGLIDRKVVKKVVMTLAYNSSAQSHTEYIVAALRDKGMTTEGSDAFVPEKIRKSFVAAVGMATREAMGDALPDVIDFKKWIATAAYAQSCAVGDIKFKTPSGTTVVQSKRAFTYYQVNTSGSKKFQVLVVTGHTDEDLPGQHKTCTMPNLVHALDASILHMSFAQFDKPFALIHDSVVTTASDMGAAIDAYKKAYVDHFADGSFWNHVLDVFSVLGKSEKEEIKACVPKLGELNVADALKSDYLLA